MLGSLIHYVRYTEYVNFVLNLNLNMNRFTPIVQNISVFYLPSSVCVLLCQPKGMRTEHVHPAALLIKYSLEVPLFTLA